MDEGTFNDIRLSLDLIRSANPADRRRGVAILSQMKEDERVQRVFALLSREDPDPSVRVAARDALNQGEPTLSTVQPSLAPAVVEKQPPAETRPEERPPLFLVNPANASIIKKYTRRSDKPPKGSRVILAVVGIALLIAGIFWGLVLPDWWHWYQLRQSGVETNATITSLQDRGHDHYVVTYRFTISHGRLDENAKGYSGEWQTTRSQFEQLEQDDLVPITYLPDDPSIARLHIDTPETVQRNQRTYAATGLTLLAIFLLLYNAHRRSRRSFRILRGEVVACKGYADKNGAYRIILRYRFNKANGMAIMGQIGRVRNDLKEGGLPSAGTPVAVYYRGERTYKVL